MKKWSRNRKALAFLLVLFVGVQAIRPVKNTGSRHGLTDITKVMNVPDSVLGILKKSCYDCHSDYTSYPWYDQISPINWWMAFHIEEGKLELNFTRFGEYASKKRSNKLKEIAETVGKGEMPLPSYLWMHGDAKLIEKEKRIIREWAMRSVKSEL